jgi:hypothetical protein
VSEDQQIQFEKLEQLAMSESDKAFIETRRRLGFCVMFGLYPWAFTFQAYQKWADERMCEQNERIAERGSPV